MSVQPPPFAYGQHYPQPAPPQRRKRTGMIVAIVAVVVAILAGAAIASVLVVRSKANDAYIDELTSSGVSTSNWDPWIDFGREVCDIPESDAEAMVQLGNRYGLNGYETGYADHAARATLCK